MLRVNSADWKIKFSLLSICEGNCVNNSECSETDEKANRRFAPFPVASDGLGPENFNYEMEFIESEGKYCSVFPSFWARQVPFHGKTNN